MADNRLLRRGSTPSARRGLLVLGSVALSLAGCQFDPHSASYARKEPRPAAIVGVWKPTRQSLEQLNSGGSGALQPEIEILADGVIRMRDIPVGWKSGAIKLGATGEGFDGRWKLERHQRWWGVTLSDSAWGCSGCLMVMQDEPPHGLFLGYGDPDAGVGVEFERATQ